LIYNPVLDNSMKT